MPSATSGPTASMNFPSASAMMDSAMILLVAPMRTASRTMDTKSVSFADIKILVNERADHGEEDPPIGYRSCKMDLSAEPRRRNSIPQRSPAEETSRIVWRDPEIGRRERLGSKSHAT